MQSFTVDVIQLFYIFTVVELLVCIPNAIFSVYFAVKAFGTTTLNVNFRVIMVVEALMCTFTSIVHVIQQLIYKPLYSVEGHQYTAAVCYYLFGYASQVAAFMFDIKYALIAYERTIAFEDRKNYELKGPEVATKYLVRAFVIIALLVLVKCIIIYTSNMSLPIDDRLKKSVILEGDYDWFGFSYFCAWFSIPYSIYKVIRLKNMLDACTSLESLSAMYEVRQISLTVKYIKRLISVFLCTLMACGVASCVNVYLHFYKKVEDDSYEMRTTSSFVYTSISIYNVISTYYMVREFPQLQRVIYRDFRILRRNALHVPYERPDDHTERHFQHLTAIWNK